MSILILVVASLTGWFLVGLEEVSAGYDNRSHKIQMQQHSIAGYSFCEDGRAWADSLIITLVVAYILSKYHFAYLSWESGVAFLAMVILAGVCGYFGNKMTSRKHPSAYAHDGKITRAGWTHLFFMVMAFYVVAMFYGTYSPVDLPASSIEIVAISLLITLSFVIKYRKFTRPWKFDVPTTLKVVVQCAFLWAATGWRLLWF
jgi:hypothetical protein